jgi:hypothetical protein
MINNNSMRGMAHLGKTPDDNIGALSSASSARTAYFWVGVEAVQQRNIRDNIARKAVGGKGLAKEPDYIFPKNSDDWVAPTYTILQRAIPMPPLGESLELNDWEATRLREQMPEGSLLTAGEGGEAIANYLKEQIDSGVTIYDLTKGKFTLEKGAPVRSIDDFEDDEILAILKKRGVAKKIIEAKE